MNHYKIADLIIAMEGAGEILQKLMKPYGVDTKGKADITMSIEREKNEQDRGGISPSVV